MIRSAHATWNGGLKGGNGTFSTASGAVRDVPYSFATRFEQSPGSNPEELIAAAHSACYSMALSGQLEAANLTPRSVQTRADVSLEKDAAGFTVKSVHLDVTADIPNATPEQFETIAENAKKTCPISRLLNATITLEARLGSGAPASR